MVWRWPESGRNFGRTSSGERRKDGAKSAGPRKEDGKEMVRQ